jgi:transcriptional regulator with XRE-family HTH domain
MTLQNKLTRLAEGRIKSFVCRQAGLHPCALSAYLHRGQIPSAEVALRLARALGVSVEWLVDPEQDWPPALADAPKREPTRAA